MDDTMSRCVVGGDDFGRHEALGLLDVATISSDSLDIDINDESSNEYADPGAIYRTVCALYDLARASSIIDEIMPDSSDVDLPSMFFTGFEVDPETAREPPVCKLLD